MIPNPETIVAFTGHRTYRNEAAELLRGRIEALYARGMRTFLCGMAVGFDLAAGEAVVACRATCPDLRLVAVVPFRGQELRFPAAERRRFEQLLEEADERVILAEAYHRGCYAVRNDFLVAHAALLVAWYDGSRSGGTRYTVQRALERDRELWNLHPSSRLAVRPARLF